MVSLPPAVAQSWKQVQGDARLREALPPTLRSDGVFVDHDPEERRLGSGGGTVHLLHQGWKATGRDTALLDWLEEKPSVVLHAGGQSRRLPAYAGCGKVFVPVPITSSPPGAAVGQTLCDLQAPLYRETLLKAGPRARMLLASGDVWLDFDAGDIPEVSADVVGLGMRVEPEEATGFGVFFVDRRSKQGSEASIAGFLQKPPVEEIHRRMAEYDFYVDTGLWLLSSRALAVLFGICGWDAQEHTFNTQDGLPLAHDFYGEFARALGDPAALTPALKVAGLDGLSSAMVPLEFATFQHLGTSRQLIETMEKLRRPGPAGASSGLQASLSDASRVVLPDDGSPTWLDRTAPEQPLAAGGRNLITGVADDTRLTRVPRSFCVDLVPLQEGKCALRVHHIDDRFRGELSDTTAFCGRPLPEWAKARGLELDPRIDLQERRLFPVLATEEITDDWVDWFTSDTPDPARSKEFLARERLSASELSQRFDFPEFLRQRQRGIQKELSALALELRAQPSSILPMLDLRCFAQQMKTQLPERIQSLEQHRDEILGRCARATDRARLLMFFDELGIEGDLPHRAFGVLQEAILDSTIESGVRPQKALLEDQIVWARSPVRLDLAGGWTDTPPYCLERGGSVVNLAVNLNGQPPIQVFVRPTKEHVLKLQSIDLGISETIRTDEHLSSFRDPSSGFSLGKAALALTGFLPPYAPGGDRSLEQRLRSFGGGMEISLLCAVPKGSGLGTSSILGATLLAALNRACGLDWDREQLYRRVLALEQLLTTGGGWQDQAGAIYGGLKLIESRPGPRQDPLVRYLPDNTLFAQYPRPEVLLYYTGITRLAKNILAEIVRRMFLGTRESERTLASIRVNARRLYRSFQYAQEEEVAEALRRSWELNCRLDPGTTNEPIEALLSPLQPHLRAWKLLGAGGGGYLLMLAHDEPSAMRIRRFLDQKPPNPRARFVDVSLARQGLQVTVS